MSFTRLLFVEDNEALREAVCEFLGLEGFKVTTAADGAQALRLLLEGGPYDVLLVDDEMPRLTGRELLSALRGAGNPIPAVLYSASLVLSEQECARLGVPQVLRKPLPLPDLVSALRQAVAAGPVL